MTNGAIAAVVVGGRVVAVRRQPAARIQLEHPDVFVRRRAVGLRFSRDQRAAPAVGVEVRRVPFPKRAVAFQHGQQLVAHVLGAAHVAVAEQRPHPERLPTQGQVAVIVERRALKLLAADFQLRVVEEHLALPGVEEEDIIRLEQRRLIRREERNGRAR